MDSGGRPAEALHLVFEVQLELFETFLFHFFVRRQPGSSFELFEPSLVILVLRPEFLEGGGRLLNLLGVWGHANPPFEVSSGTILSKPKAGHNAADTTPLEPSTFGSSGMT
jgi:hypothetical protein